MRSSSCLMCSTPCRAARYRRRTVSSRTRLIALLVLLAALFVPSTSGSATAGASRADAPARIGLVLDGSRDDESFNQLAYEGALIARTRYDINFEQVQAGTTSTQGYTRR